MIINANRSETYVGTVNLNDPEDQAWIQTIRTFVSEANAQFPKQRYVKLQGRGLVHITDVVIIKAFPLSMPKWQTYMFTHVTLTPRDLV